MVELRRLLNGAVVFLLLVFACEASAETLAWKAQPLENARMRALSVRFSGDGRLVGAACINDSLENGRVVWNCSNGKVVATTNVEESIPLAVAFSRGDERLY